MRAVLGLVAALGTTAALLVRAWLQDRHRAELRRRSLDCPAACRSRHHVKVHRP